MPRKEKKIGEILLENGFITKKILDEALDYQAKYGGNITEYLIKGGYISENELARCLSSQFGYPFLPLKAYDVPMMIVNLIPVEVAKKYRLMPIDKMEDIITVIMADPLDLKAIDEVRKITGCSVQPFVGMLSDIKDAIEFYYKVSAERFLQEKSEISEPLLTDKKAYAGIEYRKSVRIDADIVIHFPYQDRYQKSRTKNISMHGLLFEYKNALPIDSYVMIQIDLPDEFSPYPIAAVGQVVRVKPLGTERFDIAVRMVSISPQDAEKIVKYAALSRKDRDEKGDHTKGLTIFLAIALASGAISSACLSPNGYALDADKNAPAPAYLKHEDSAVRVIELAINADRNKIIEEMKAIKAMKAVKADPKDIASREATIKSLKKEISDMKIRKNHLVYGDQVIPRRKDETHY